MKPWRMTPIWMPSEVFLHMPALVIKAKAVNGMKFTSILTMASRAFRDPAFINGCTLPSRELERKCIYPIYGISSNHKKEIRPYHKGRKHFVAAIESMLPWNRAFPHFNAGDNASPDIKRTAYNNLHRIKIRGKKKGRSLETASIRRWKATFFNILAKICKFSKCKYINFLIMSNRRWCRP